MSVRRGGIAGALALMTAVLASCQAWHEEESLLLRPASFAEMPGWDSASAAEALGAFRQSCAVWSKDAAKIPQKLGGVVTRRADWQHACAMAASANESAASGFFASHFSPYRAVSSYGRSKGLLTGYYEPLVQASRHRSAEYSVPVWGVPHDLKPGKPYATREEIDRRGLNGKAPVLLWMKDPIDLFFLQVQGSGRVALAEGGAARLQFAAKNGQPYRSIGAALIESGEIKREAVSLASLKAWLHAAPPAKRNALLWKNPSYIFFALRPESPEGPPGAQGAPLTAEASLAVDPAHIPYGAPVWLDTTLPGSGLYRRLLIAQDTGSAIKGPLRGDVFFGAGKRAEQRAGGMKQPGRFFLLLPKRTS